MVTSFFIINEIAYNYFGDENINQGCFLRDAVFVINTLRK